MKIAMVSPYDFTWPGGVTAHVSQLSRELTQLGHQVQVLAPHSPSRECPDSNSFIPLGRSVPVPRAGSVARLSLSWWLNHRIRTLLERESYDIIHLHEPLAPMLPLFVLEHSNSVNIGTFHAFSQQPYLYRLARPVVGRWHRRLHGCIAVSPAAMSYVGRPFPSEYQLIPNGIDVDHFGSGASPWPQYQDNKTNILFVGRLERRKGLRYLLQAYCQLKWELPDIRLIVVGPGDLDKDSHRILGASNPKDVIFTGRVSYKDLARYYSTADIFCSPATGSESFGIVLLEAMAAGKPVVASDIDGYRGVIQHGRQGLLFPKENSDALATTLRLLITNPQSGKEMGAAGRCMVEAYRWANVAKRIETYYHDRIHSVRSELNGSGYACQRAV